MTSKTNRKLAIRYVFKVCQRASAKIGTIVVAKGGDLQAGQDAGHNQLRDRLRTLTILLANRALEAIYLLGWVTIESWFQRVLNWINPAATDSFVVNALIHIFGTANVLIVAAHLYVDVRDVAVKVRLRKSPDGSSK
jgi:hypothetical protein